MYIIDCIMNSIITKRAITYSVLAHIKNSEGLLAEGPLDVFIPLVKKTLHYLNAGIEQYKGANISEISTVIQEQYGIDFPLPVLRSLLQKLAKEINSERETIFQLFKDDAFWIKDFVFEDFDEQLKESKRRVEDLQRAFREFCAINNVQNIEDCCIVKFIEKNKFLISQYLSHKTIPNGHNYTVPALFVDYFRKTPNFYSQIKDIYLGAVLTCILDYEFVSTKIEVTLLLDTNFIISLIDLNTPESTHTCTKLLEVCGKIGYKFVILQDTIDEIKNLISFKANNYDRAVISRYVNKEDVFNACERRRLSKVDLERICDNLEVTLQQYNIIVTSISSSLRNKAKFSREYAALKTYRNTEKAALHDAMAILYVKEKRGKNVKKFEEVNCWFVNNSITHDVDGENVDTVINSNNNQFQPEIIRADNLLNILWLSNPSINTSLANSELVDMGLTSLVAYTLNEALPKARIIKELDDNIQRYKSQEITDRDVYLLSSRIVNNQIKNIENLNELAAKDADEFNRRIKEEAEKQEEIENDRATKFHNLFEKLEITISDITVQKGKIEQKKEVEKQEEIEKIKIESRNEVLRKISELELKNKEIELLKKTNLDIENRIREEKRNVYIKRELIKWRTKSWIWLTFFGLLFLITLVWIIILFNGNLKEANRFIDQVLQCKIVVVLLGFVVFIIESLVIRSLYDKYRNYSNINAFKEGIDIPEEIKSLKE